MMATTHALGLLGVAAPMDMGDSTALSTPTPPAARPQDPRFSPGPTRKFPGWTLDHLKSAELGRSHRSKPGKARLKILIDRSKTLLGMPDDWVLGIVAGSDTGAVEAAMWNMFGQRGVEALVWESFGSDWAKDIKDQLKISDLKVHEAAYGKLPDLDKIDFDKDVSLTWNGTTSGVRLTDGDFIPDDRGGLVLADATSAAFAMDLPWDKLDIVTWSWQKVLGGEAAHGMLALSPRAVQRLESYTPERAIPKIFQLTKKGALNAGIFEGATQNTPSMLAVEDCLAALDWADSVGGLVGLINRTDNNAQVLFDWIDQSPWIANLCEDPKHRSTTGVCMKIVDPDIAALDLDVQGKFAKDLCALLDKNGVAYDIGAYRNAPPGIRIWTGATIESADLKALTPWLDYAFQVTKNQYLQASKA